MLHRAGALALSALVLLLAAACGGGSGTTTTISTPRPQPQVTPNVVTGDGEIDSLIRLAMVSDDIQLASLAGYESLACKKEPAPGDLAPKCRDNEAEGKSVEVLPSSGCDRTFVRPEQVPDAFRAVFPGKATDVVAAYRPKADALLYGGGFGNKQVIVFRTGLHPNGAAAGVALHVKDGRVVWIESDCDNLFALMVPERVDSFIVDPRDLGSPVAATATPVLD
jgi:hypothetical protein